MSDHNEPTQADCIADFQRVVEWAKSKNRKPANLAFTAGPERQAAYWIELAEINMPNQSRQHVVRWDIKRSLDRLEWNLLRQDGTSAATVYDNGVWHTWDENGVGGENGAEASVELAKAEAVLSALNQGFLTSNPKVTLASEASVDVGRVVGTKIQGGQK